MEGRAHVCRKRNGGMVMMFRRPQVQVQGVLRRRFGWVRSPEVLEVLKDYGALLLETAMWMREKGYMQGLDRLEWDQAQELVSEKAAVWDGARVEALRKVLDRLPGVYRKAALCWSGKRAERQARESGTAVE